MKLTGLFFAIGLAVVGCSGDDDDSPSSGKLQAPMLMHVMPMEGALHLEWMNGQGDCDLVEAERKMHSDPFEPIFSVPGTADNKMDASATEDMDYTYRLRCKKGGSFYSDYSNEMSSNPTRE